MQHLQHRDVTPGQQYCHGCDWSRNCTQHLLTLARTLPRG